MQHSRLSWVQIPARDLQRAANFYKGVFGFDFFFEDLNGIPHAVFKEDLNGNKPVNGAIIQLSEEAVMGSGPVLFYDAAGDFDYILSQVEECGGEVINRKTLIKAKIDDDFSYIPNTYIDSHPGYFAHFLDSEGNRCGLYGQS